MRKLAFLVHPDRFPGALAPQAEVNAVSLAALQGLLSTVQKSKDSHPPAQIQRLAFHVHAQGGGTRRVEVLLKTTGGNCRAVVEKSLAGLFAQLGLPPSFRWGSGDWDILSETARAERDNRGDSPPSAEAQSTTPAAAAAAPPPPAPERSAAPVPERTAAELADALKQLDPALNALAFVPWLPSDEQGALRRHYILHEVLPGLVAKGWAIDSGVRRIWLGERDSASLVAAEMAAGTDAASCEAAKQVLFHTRALETELGAPPSA